MTDDYHTYHYLRSQAQHAQKRSKTMGAGLDIDRFETPEPVPKAPGEDLVKVIKDGADKVVIELDQLMANLEKIGDVYVDTWGVRDVRTKAFETREAIENKLHKLSTIINGL